MGLIGMVFGAITGIPTAADRALIDTLCLAAISDGNASDLERSYALGIALDLPGFARKSKADVEKLLSKAFDEITQAGDPKAGMRRVVERLDEPELREQAYTLAAVVEYVDRKVQDSERSFLAEFQKQLKLSDDKVAQIHAEIEKELASMGPPEKA